MANVIQDVMGNFAPKGDGAGFTLPTINTYDAVLYSLIGILILLILVFAYRFFVYKIKILELEDRGRNSLKARVLLAKKIYENGRPKYQLWGMKDPNSTGFFKKPLRINASPSDNLIPLKIMGIIYRDLVMMHRDKLGDFRPWKVIVNKDQINVEDYYKKGTGDEKIFEMEKFLDDLFPVLKIDNLKMRGWYHLNVKETIGMYKEKSGLSPEARNVMMILFVVFALCVGAYMYLG